jgi:hypothetical protein
VNATQLHQAILKIPTHPGLCNAAAFQMGHSAARLAAAELVLAAGLPQWREKPDSEGLWILETPNGFVFRHVHFEPGKTFGSGNWYGPLPSPPEGVER